MACPYGARARMILLYLQTQAVRTGSREVALGRSMRDWMERMGLAIGGETAHSPARTGRPDLRLHPEVLLGGRHAEGWARGAIVTSGLRFKVPEDSQGSLWEDRVVLDEMFWKALRDHPVPVLEAAIRQLRDRSMSLDIYVWLAWRCHQLGKPTAISWPAVHAQFGAGFQGCGIKPRFIEALGPPPRPTPRPGWTSETPGSHCTRPGHPSRISGPGWPALNPTAAVHMLGRLRDGWPDKRQAHHAAGHLVPTSPIYKVRPGSSCGITKLSQHESD